MLNSEKGHNSVFFYGFVCFDALRPSQQFCSNVRTISGLPGLNQYYAADKVSCSRIQHSDIASGESRDPQPYALPTEPLRFMQNTGHLFFNGGSACKISR